MRRMVSLLAIRLQISSTVLSTTLKFSSCPTVIEQASIVVETNKMDYNILPYKHLAAKRMIIQHFLTSGVRIKTDRGMAKNTVLLKLNLFSRNSKKPFSSLR